MHTTKKTFDVYGTSYTCYFYNNGYDQVVSVLSEDISEVLFKFNEQINESQVHFLLKGYHIGSNNVVSR